MSSDVEWIAVDWGTSRLRVWAMAGDEVLAQAESEHGMSSLKSDEFEPALLDIVGDWLGDRPMDVLCCGMVGARQGWIEADYLPVPGAPILTKPVQVPDTDPRLNVYIVPGMKQAQPADVMRGEETQIAGFLAENDGWDGVICLPGTHTKWVHVSAGEVVSFRSFMTGELFSLLSKNSVLRHSVSEGWDEVAFRNAVSDTLSRPEILASELFGLRASQLLDQTPQGELRSRLSGLLIGTELRGAKPYWLGQQIAVIGSMELADIYRIALEDQGLNAALVPSDHLVRLGLRAIRSHMGAQK